MSSGEPAEHTEQPKAVPASPAPNDAGIAARIAGLSSLKGLVVYGAVLTYAGFYIYFMAKIVAAPTGKPPALNGVMVSAAAALAGVLGSAFALVIGAPSTATNEGLEHALNRRVGSPPRGLLLRRIFSLEPGGKKVASYPLTFGVWVYALIAGAVAIVYFLCQTETPATIKALATVFAGYVVALMTAAYGIATKS